jgi:hypothetical protein
MHVTTFDQHGKVISEHDEPDPPPQPLDDHGALVTLLAVKGVITADDGAKLLRVDKTVLEAEALAWEAVAPVKR